MQATNALDARTTSESQPVKMQDGDGYGGSYDDDNGSGDFNFQVRDQVPNEFARNLGFQMESNLTAGYPQMMTEFTPIYDAPLEQRKVPQSPPKFTNNNVNVTFTDTLEEDRLGAQDTLRVDQELQGGIDELNTQWRRRGGTSADQEAAITSTLDIQF